MTHVFLVFLVFAVAVVSRPTIRLCSLFKVRQVMDGLIITYYKVGLCYELLMTGCLLLFRSKKIDGNSISAVYSVAKLPPGKGLVP